MNKSRQEYFDMVIDDNNLFENNKTSEVCYITPVLINLGVTTVRYLSDIFFSTQGESYPRAMGIKNGILIINKETKKWTVEISKEIPLDFIRFEKIVYPNYNLWEKNGDHPLDGDKTREGKVVRYFRNPEVIGCKHCVKCGKTMHEHGFIESGIAKYSIDLTVCPGSYVIEFADGKFDNISQDRFIKLMEDEKNA